MSTPAQKANLARIRETQKRSRARRREYLRELEQRLRVYELQGVEASSEVQKAARRVAEENRQLRGLLNRHGITDDYISSYLHTGGAAAQAGPMSIPHFPSSNPSEAVQSLQHVIAPRRPAPLDPGVSYVVPPQESNKTSTASASTTNIPPWEPGLANQRYPAIDQHFPYNVPPSTLQLPSDIHQQRPDLLVVPVTQASLTGAHNSGARFAPPLYYPPLHLSKVGETLMESWGHPAG